MSIVLDGSNGLTTPGVVNTAGETIATTLAVTGASTLTGAVGIGGANVYGNQLVISGANGNSSNTALLRLNNTTGVAGATRLSLAVDDANNKVYFVGGGSSVNPTMIWSNNDSSVALMSLTQAGLFQFNSGYGSAATAYGCRAWVNFNGTGTVAIRASGNVSSITDNAAGDYTVNFTTAMVDANYAALADSNGGTATITARAPGVIQLYDPTTSYLKIYVQAPATGAAVDPGLVFVSIFR